MGLTDSKPLSADERSNREQAKLDIVNQRKAEIEQAQRNIVNERSIISASDMVTMIKVSETAKKQLDRNGDALTKADLVAIVIALQPDSKSKLRELEQLRVSDLNTMIRSIIYDPSRLMNTKSQQAVDEPERTTYFLQSPINKPIQTSRKLLELGFSKE